MVMEVLPLPRDGVRAPKTIFALLNVVVVHYGCGRQLQDLTIITESGPCVSVNIVRFPYPLRKWHSWQLGNLTSVNTASFCTSVLTSSKLWGPNCIGDDPLDVIEDWVGVRIWRYIPGIRYQVSGIYLVQDNEKF